MPESKPDRDFDSDHDAKSTSSSSDSTPTPSSRDVLKKAMAYCWSEDFLGRFRKFFTDHAGVFEEHALINMAASKTEDVAAPTIEHDLEHHACFTKYLTLFEDTLEAYVTSQNSSNAAFFLQLMTLKNSSDITGDEKLFIDCLLASADYDSFYSVMVKEAKKLIVMREHSKRFGSADVEPDGDFAYEGRQYGDDGDRSRRVAESKGGGDSDEEDAKGAK